MHSLRTLIRSLIALRQRGLCLTLLAACPNSAAVLEAAVLAAARHKTPMLFAATLNQVDRDGGYTGWTPQAFVAQMQTFARKYEWDGPLYACLDHGGPWLKDDHTLRQLSLEETMGEVKQSLTACIKAGYKLLHIDPTVDRTLPKNAPVPIDVVVDRTVELIAHAEAERMRLGAPEIEYEVGTEEVAGGLVDFGAFEHFVNRLRVELEGRGLGHAYPCFIVARVGTDLHTSFFDPDTARRLYEVVAPHGALIKGHYTDWVENPQSYPLSGMGGANVGPEFTTVECVALAELCERENALCAHLPGLRSSRLMEVLEQAVHDSGRWRKWLTQAEQGQDFFALAPQRRQWLTQTGARYIWTAPEVRAARQQLYTNLTAAPRPLMRDPHQYVVERIAGAMQKYVFAFNLYDACTLLDGEARALAPDGG